VASFRRDAARSSALLATDDAAASVGLLSRAGWWQDGEMTSAAQMISDYLGAATKAGASRSTLRQRRWALGLLLEQAEAIAHEDRTGATSADGGASADESNGRTASGDGASPSGEAPSDGGASQAPSDGRVSPDALGKLSVSAFLALGPRAEGRLLALNPDTPIPTMRAWRASIRALATYAGMDADAPSLPRPLARKVLSSEGVRALETLRHRQMVTLMPEEQARLAMVLALLATAPLTGTQLCAVRLTDLDERMTTLRLPPAQPHEWRRLELSPETAPAEPQATTAQKTQKAADQNPKATDETPAPEPVLLPAYAKDAIVRWLAVRESLVGALQGKTDVLLVSVAANHDPRTRATLPPGLPLKPRGLQRSFARAALAANAELTGQPGFPLPRSLELARRSYHAWRS
jgi:integrase